MKKLLSLILALSMVFQMTLCNVSFAEENSKVKVQYTDPQGVTQELELEVPLRLTNEGQYVINGDISTSNYNTALRVYNENGEEVKVQITGTITGFTGVNASGEQVAVEVTGKVEGSSTAVNASNGADVVVGDATGSLNAESGSQITADSVSAEYTAIQASGDSSVTFVTVDGDVTSTSGHGVQAIGESSVEVSGEVTAAVNGVNVEGNGEVTVGGI